MNINDVRQVGKTNLIRDFAKGYRHVVMLNLEKRQTAVILRRLKMDVASFLVGRVEYLYLYPLNFPEYLEAAGKVALQEQLDAAKVIRLIYPTTDLNPHLKKYLKKSPRLQFLGTGLVN